MSADAARKSACATMWSNLMAGGYLGAEMFPMQVR